MNDEIDLEAYFARIRYRGGVAPTLETLNAIASAHVQAIPFENLDVLLGRPIDLGPGALQRKLIRDRRGGYCFEQNGLFLLVLEAVGFDVRPLSARVRIQRPRDFLPPRTHVFLRVELEGTSWLADVGVGGLSLASAIRLDAPGEQPTPHEPRRIVREGPLLFHQVRLGDSWEDVCEFTLEEMPLIDRELANWFTSTHPMSHFKSRLMVARARPDGARVTLQNRELKHRDGRGTAQTRMLSTPAELVTALALEFDLHFEPGTEFPCTGVDWAQPR